MSNPLDVQQTLDHWVDGWRWAVSALFRSRIWLRAFTDRS